MTSFRNPFWLVAAAWLTGAAVFTSSGYAAQEAAPFAKMGPAAGDRRYRPGLWAVVEVNAVNPTDEAVELYSAVYFADDPTLQYGRKVWIPGKSMLRSTCPIRIPESVHPGRDHVSVMAASIDPMTGRDISGKSLMESISKSTLLIVSHEPLAACILGDFEPPLLHPGELPYHTAPEGPPPAPDDRVYDLVVAAKLTQEGLSRRVGVLNAWDLPADPACLDASDVVVLCSNRLASDSNATALIRDWVLGGGNLWIMLDEMEGDSVSALLGDTFTSTIVDRVMLSELIIEDVRTDSLRDEATILEFETPIPFVRVVPRGVVVTDTVDGWPAAFRQPFGAGHVFFTTLGVDAWCRPTTDEDPHVEDPAYAASFVARPPLQRLASTCFAKSPPVQLDDRAIEPVLAEQIGYRILSKEAVAAVLAAFCTALCLAGGGFWKAGRLAHILWAGPAIATVASLVFLVVATTSRTSVPATAAIWQSVALEPGVATGHCRGLASLYNPSQSDTEMGADRGGIFLPDMAAMRGQRRRMMWTDEGRWHWQDLQLPPGIRTAPFEHLLHLEDTVDCRATFDASGVRGLFGPTSFRGFSDALIVVPNQAPLAATVRADGSFTAGGNDVLPSGQFVAGSLLSDEQQRHAKIYRLLLNRPATGEMDARAMLYAWIDPVDTGFVLPQANRIGSTLVSIPLQWKHAPRGSQVVVPASFLPYAGVPGPDGRQSGAYSRFRGEWGELKVPATEWVRFQLPDAVLPIELTRAEISWSIRAPSRDVEVLASNGKQPVVLDSYSHPIGTFQLHVDQSELLQLDEEGGWIMAIRVGAEESEDTVDLMQQASWKVESLHVTLTGKVLGE